LGLRNLLDQFGEAPIDGAVIERAIEIRKSVRIKIPDALVAATAVIYEANLVTRNTSDSRCQIRDIGETPTVILEGVHAARATGCPGKTCGEIQDVDFLRSAFALVK